MLKRLLLLAGIISLGMSSCKVDACKDVVCLNNGVCDNGDCVCEAGYEGFNCEIEQRLAYIGSYDVEESCNLGSFSYSIVLIADSETGTEITLSNFGDFGFDIIGIVNGSEITFTDQTGNGSTVNGTGILESENGVLTINYTMITSSAQTLECTMVCTAH